jgi:alpha-amylase/alpha-mannosidase (GH57 family)
MARIKVWTPNEVLAAFDPRYFKNLKEEITWEDAAYHLATWLFDHNDDMEEARKQLKKGVSVDLYVQAMEKYLDGDHDT